MCFDDFILDIFTMSTNEQSSHVSLSIPSEQPPPSDNFNFVSGTFTLPQDGQSGSSQIPPSQGYAGWFYFVVNYKNGFCVFREDRF
jgi:hypothetical protein